MTNQFRSDAERIVSLTPIERENILKIDPDFSIITKALYFDNYDLPCPIRVELAAKDSNHKTVVLRKTRHGSVENEVRILRALKESGLPVPEVIRDPFENEKGEKAAVYSLLPGENLQKLSMRGAHYLTESKNLMIEAIIKLRDVSAFIKKHNASEIIPEQTLSAELESVRTNNNSWINNKNYRAGVEELQKRLQGIDTPLVFSNGDYQPGNFLAQNGTITGFLDFESAVFQDPLVGFAKYPIYDLRPLSRTDLISEFLSATGFTKEDFNIRLALGCLKILKKEVPVSNGDVETETYRNKILKLLNESLCS